MTVANGQFFDLNASGDLQRQHRKLTRIHPGVVRRNRPEPEPDRSHVEGAPPPSPPAKEPSEMAGKKRSAESIAKAKATWAKKRADKEAAALAKKMSRAAKKKRGRRIEQQIAEHVRPAAVEPRELPMLPQAALRHFVQRVVRESIRDEVRIYLDECFGISEDPEAVPLAPAKRGGK
jgi:hypothetical protein